MVANAWAGFGAAFGPVILLSLYWQRMTAAGALAGMLGGAVTVLAWVYAPLQINGQQLNDYLYAMVPGVLVSTAFALLVSRFTTPPTIANTHFEQLHRQLAE